MGLGDVLSVENLQKATQILQVLGGGSQDAIYDPGWGYEYPRDYYGGGTYAGQQPFSNVAYQMPAAVPAAGVGGLAALGVQGLTKLAQLLAAGYTIEAAMEALGIGGPGGLLPGPVGGGGTGACPAMFRDTRASSRPVRFIEADDPVTGKRQYWELRGRPILFSGDERACRRYAKATGKKLVRRGG